MLQKPGQAPAWWATWLACRVYLPTYILFLALFSVWSIYEIIHIWIAVIDESEEWSLQWIFQFKQLERSLKKSELQQDSNLWPPRIPVRCSTELWSHTFRVRSINWVHIFPWVKWCEMMWSIYEIIHLNCSCRWKWRMIIAVNFPI